MKGPFLSGISETFSHQTAAVGIALVVSIGNLSGLAAPWLIGKIKEVHTWSEKKWGDTTRLQTAADVVPSGFNWDDWLGVAPARPFIKDAYHPGNWRKRLDFPQYQNTVNE
jgi:hypothetical protein